MNNGFVGTDRLRGDAKVRRRGLSIAAIEDNHRAVFFVNQGDQPKLVLLRFCAPGRRLSAIVTAAKVFLEPAIQRNKQVAATHLLNFEL
jgi:hypothetical protein